MVDDAILSREVAYIYQYAVGFSPVGGDLTRWRGVVQDSAGNVAELEVQIPQGFPYDPPVLKLPGTTQHPRVNSKGKLITRSLQSWSPNSHVYSLIREAKSVLRSGTFRDIQKTDSSEQESKLRNQKSNLRAQLETKKQEYQKLNQQTVQEVAQTQDVGQLIQDSLIEVENEAYALEDAYDNLDIKAIDFAKQFVDARKRYYLIDSSREAA